MRLTDYDRARIVGLRDLGLTYRAIAKDIGCDHTTVACVINPDYREQHRVNNARLRKESPETRRLRAEARELATLERELERAFKAQRRMRQTDPVLAAVTYAKYRARYAELPFDPAIAGVLAAVPANCPACGRGMAFHKKESKRTAQTDSPSVDRVIPELGYVPGNVQWLCFSCNSTKSNGTMDELYMRLAERQAA